MKVSSEETLEMLITVQRLVNIGSNFFILLSFHLCVIFKFILDCMQLANLNLNAVMSSSRFLLRSQTMSANTLLYFLYYSSAKSP